MKPSKKDGVCKLVEFGELHGFSKQVHRMLVCTRQCVLGAWKGLFVLAMDSLSLV